MSASSAPERCDARVVAGVGRGVDIATPAANWQRAAGGFDRLVTRVGDDEWTRATPCAKWDVRALVNHVTRGNHNYVLLLRGGDREEFLRRRELDALGSHPAAAHRHSAATLTAAFAASGAASRTLDHPLGPMSGATALGVRTIDTVIHTWDLARAIGADEGADDELVQWAEEHWDRRSRRRPHDEAGAAPAPHGSECPRPSGRDRGGRR